MAFCIPEEEYDENLHVIVSGPHENCDSCSTFPIPEGSDVVVQTTFDLNGAKMSLIFSDVTAPGTVSVGREFNKILTPLGSTENYELLVLDFGSSSYGSAIVKFEFPESTLNSDFDVIRPFLLDDSPISVGDPFIDGSYKLRDILILSPEYSKDYSTRSMYGYLGSSPIPAPELSILANTTKKIGWVFIPCSPGQVSCTKATDYFHSCYDPCSIGGEVSPYQARDEYCYCAPQGYCCADGKQSIIASDLGALEPNGDQNIQQPDPNIKNGKQKCEESKGNWKTTKHEYCCKENWVPNTVAGKGACCPPGYSGCSVEENLDADGNQIVDEKGDPIKYPYYGFCIEPCTEYEVLDGCVCVCKENCPEHAEHPKVKPPPGPREFWFFPFDKVDCSTCECEDASTGWCPGVGQFSKIVPTMREKDPSVLESCECECDNELTKCIKFDKDNNQIMQHQGGGVGNPSELCLCECLDVPCPIIGQYRSTEWGCECKCTGESANPPTSEKCKPENGTEGCYEKCPAAQKRNLKTCECECENGGKLCDPLDGVIGSPICIDCPHGNDPLTCECTCPDMTFGGQSYQGTYIFAFNDCYYDVTCYRCDETTGKCRSQSAALTKGEIEGKPNCSDWSSSNSVKFNTCAEAEADCCPPDHNKSSAVGLLNSLSAVCVPNCNAEQFACAKGSCCEDNPFLPGTNLCVPSCACQPACPEGKTHDDSCECVDCPSDRDCNGTCCPEGYLCIAGTCCPSESVCNGGCCPDGEVCVNGQCCPFDKACGENCCPDGYACQNGECLTDLYYCQNGQNNAI